MDAVSHLIRLARVDASLDKHCMLSVSTAMDVSYASERTAPFHVLLEGTCQLQVGMHLLELKPGDVVLIPRGESHRIITPGHAHLRGVTESLGDAFTTTLSEGGGDPVIDLFCGHYTFGPGAGSILFKSLPEPVHISFGETPETDAALRMLSTLMREEAAREGEGTAAILSSLCSVLLTMILRTSRGATTDAALWTASTSATITQVVERVLTDPGGDWSIERASRMCAMSRATFIRQFERNTGTTFGAFVTRVRLMVAADLLRTTGLTVGGVAAEVGYLSESAFARAFRQEAGITPARFRRAAAGT
ncbi:AraC family transcriptional regulator [Diaminobutyricibacter tongyongensis]|uniref:AraC family transcriptional regulator n=1 Tax=Leifsonia tongyongensis TaxID=1268043 RepID=A0A6L9XWS6_9MICO|nr:AraC family transcriptional regulator [Diaminobutyricibacter tongyongensis]NEN05869.1 AraC family transcriptional regulator [Diaminobutyricibacter tongyongensis]